mgnify:CR=1 FL=1
MDVLLFQNPMAGRGKKRNRDSEADGDQATKRKKGIYQRFYINTF